MKGNSIRNQAKGLAMDDLHGQMVPFLKGIGPKVKLMAEVFSKHRRERFWKGSGRKIKQLDSVFSSKGMVKACLKGT